MQLFPQVFFNQSHFLYHQIGLFDSLKCILSPSCGLTVRAVHDVDRSALDLVLMKSSVRPPSL